MTTSEQTAASAANGHIGTVHFRICVSYIEYIEHTTGDNVSTTQQNAHAGYIKDTPKGTGDKCR